MTKTKKYSEDYFGPDRRQDCSDNCPFAEQTKKSVPRVYFFSSWSALIICAIAFAGWHVSSLDKLKVEISKNYLDHKTQVDYRIADSSRAYSQDVERFIRATTEIRKMLREVKEDIGQIKVQNAEYKTKQDLIMQKIKLTE